jgi:hypothetical protein
MWSSAMGWRSRCTAEAKKIARDAKVSVIPGFLGARTARLFLTGQPRSLIFAGRLENDVAAVKVGAMIAASREALVVRARVSLTNGRCVLA